MWPFTSRRVLGNRWWALAFVGFVCWQAAEIVGTAPSAENAADNTTTTDVTGSPVDDSALHNTIDTLRSMQ